MNAPPLGGRYARLCSWLVAFVVLSAAVPIPQEAPTQSLAERVVQQRLEVARVQAVYDAAVAAWNVLQSDWDAALDQVTRARQTLDEQLIEAALASAQERAWPVAAQEQRVVALRDSLTTARQALMERIESRLDEIIEVRDTTTNTQRRNELTTVFIDLRNELTALDEESEDPIEAQLVRFDDIAFDTRDGREERLVKADLVARQVRIVEEEIADAEGRIESLNNRLRIQRQSADLLASVDRFDDTRVPVVSGNPGGIAPDSTSAGARPLTLEERIERLEAYKAQLEQERDRLVARERQFRRGAGRVTS